MYEDCVVISGTKIKYEAVLDMYGHHALANDTFRVREHTRVVGEGICHAFCESRRVSATSMDIRVAQIYMFKHSRLLLLDASADVECGRGHCARAHVRNRPFLHTVRQYPSRLPLTPSSPSRQTSRCSRAYLHNMLSPTAVVAQASSLSRNVRMHCPSLDHLEFLSTGTCCNIPLQPPYCFPVLASAGLDISHIR